jgi:hypothetical protein
VLGSLSGLVSIAAPVVLTAAGARSVAAAPVISEVPGGLTVSIAPGWLLAEPASAFPIDVDPTTVLGANATCYSSAGQTVGPCEVRVGNYASNSAWQTTAYFNYTSLFGMNVVGAQVDL